jgi:hypothetical protein
LHRKRMGTTVGLGFLSNEGRYQDAGVQGLCTEGLKAVLSAPTTIELVPVLRELEHSTALR